MLLVVLGGHIFLRGCLNFSGRGWKGGGGLMNDGWLA